MEISSQRWLLFWKGTAGSQLVLKDATSLSRGSPWFINNTKRASSKGFSCDELQWWQFFLRYPRSALRNVGCKGRQAVRKLGTGRVRSGITATPPMSHRHSSHIRFGRIAKCPHSAMIIGSTTPAKKDQVRRG